ncbi:MAG: DUF2118 domain-containing protein, partial [Hyphomicrobiaceae bacterium]|nr:DUF2118 domain-containing protein [Hyphomicrobiaceae bacterium]
TGFIAEEYPEGFTAREPEEDEAAEFAAVALSMELVLRDRLDRLNGRLRPHSGHLRDEWTVRLGRTNVDVSVVEGMAGTPIELTLGVGGKDIRVLSDWRPGEVKWTGTLDGEPVTVQVKRDGSLTLMERRGVTVKAAVLTRRIGALAELMPVKIPPDTSKLLLCPMPGLVVSIDVAEGEEVKAGQRLAIVEAMKMENILRAERDGVVSVIKAKAGDSLAVDAVIMEFE